MCAEGEPLCGADRKPVMMRKDSIQEKRMAVRDYLLDRGFYLNDGIKYGLDFLVYTDHPDRVHSKYGLVVYSTMTFQQLVSYQRVCNSNNKVLVVAFANIRDGTANIKLVQCERFVTKSTACF